jgi:hypothetical protein
MKTNVVDEEPILRKQETDVGNKVPEQGGIKNLTSCHPLFGQQNSSETAGFSCSTLSTKTDMY